MVDNADVKTAIRRWWADFPMTYGEEHGNTEYAGQGGVEAVELGSREFFENADATFYRWNMPLHGPEGPFSRLFDYPRYRGARVLEVGCGMGCMAMNWARQGAEVAAVDINPVAVAQTRNRFSIFGLSGDIREADGETLPFESESFDFVYSWGVLHHTPGTKAAIEELRRVLKPGGGVGVMLYNRESLLYRFLVGWQEGFVNMERRWLKEVELASRYADGDRREGNPHTWPVTKREIREELFQQYQGVDIRVLGTDVPNVLNIWGPELGTKRLPLPRIKALARRWGWSLWITGKRST
ncbi:class I SAM-dependent methyltransferase [Afifella pfennigii]|uniref:class I SAM-dependent methyltransferase n=1 Tax=Afifella pfennigii TaxID=209897 RepID=UPI00047A021B|nr:class I SAM-dependent methyltransferase [Afifella pfennigii]